MIVILGVLAGAVGCAMCFYIGKMNERAAWNGLIEDGLLPPPKKRR